MHSFLAELINNNDNNIFLKYEDLTISEKYSKNKEALQQLPKARYCKA
jgi:hypothetical protein